MELRTERLTIRPLAVGEGKKIVEYFRENRDFLQPYYPTFRPDDFDAAAWERHIATVHRDIDWKRAARLTLFLADRLIGVANLTNVSGHPRFACNLGYSLSKEHQGYGYMQEALRAILPWAYSNFRLHRIEANYMPRNERSARVLEALGFEREGLARKYLLINGVWEDHVLTAKILEP